MRIPALYEKKTWQRFFAGAVCGGLISWIIFAYMYGEYQDAQIIHISKQAKEIMNLKQDIDIWKKDYEKLNEENKKGITLQEINVKLLNAERYKLDSLRKYEIEKGAKHDINHLIAKEISTVYESRELIKRTIENKVITIDEKRYRLEVRGLYLLYTNLDVEVSMRFHEE
ncbi:sporulation membrane protein YtrI [Bacillus salitolerans]|uniref:Sporulation membrane protein YtrI n=1 Tax=Bacillus salitolerans TaxID=1437434 RepID=A0ABW4LQP9_9BACI